MSASDVKVSTHPEFPNGTEVINISPKSSFFGHHGIVYGSGPSQKNASSDAVIFVTWPSGDKHSYFPKRLALAPAKEHEYKVGNSRVKDGKKITVHEILAEKRSRPTIFTRLSTKQQ